MSSETARTRSVASKIETWAENAQPGDVRVYAKSRTGFAEASADKVAAWKLHLAGAVILTQRREADRSISYLATRSRA
jgi:hypothetical protein